MKITQLTTADVAPARKIQPTVDSQLVETVSFVAPEDADEEVEYVARSSTSAASNERMKRQLKILKQSDPALYDKIVNFR